jgi:glycosyltransferase involved in cell wall biosynthesis
MFAADSFPDLSVIVIAGREEHNIADCLASVSWAGEIIVVCSQREDRTMEIARGFTPHVSHRVFEGFAAQKRAALAQATRPWVLSLDADERVTPELRSEIAHVLAGADVADSYSMPRRNYFHGKWLRHGGWYPDHQVRLFRRERATVTDRLVHEGFEVAGTRGRLTAPLLHFTVPRVRHLLEKNIDYAWYEALEKQHRRRYGIPDFIIKPPLEFCKRYILKGGFLDGWEGLVVAVIHLIVKTQVLLYLWELQRGPASEESSPRA